METLLQKCGRLVAALDDLASQEAACLTTRDFTAVLQLLDRSAPLVAFLAEHGPRLADETLRSRIFAWLGRRRQTDEWLGTQLAGARAELREIESSRRRISCVAPVYGSTTRGAGFHRLSAVG